MSIYIETTTFSDQMPIVNRLLVTHGNVGSGPLYHQQFSTTDLRVVSFDGTQGVSIFNLVVPPLTLVRAASRSNDTGNGIQQTFADGVSSATEDFDGAWDLAGESVISIGGPGSGLQVNAFLRFGRIWSEDLGQSTLEAYTLNGLPSGGVGSLVGGGLINSGLIRPRLVA